MIHKDFAIIIPEQTYSVSEAARYFGVHRCTIYAYINHPTKSLPFVRSPDKVKTAFRGADLIAYKAEERAQTTRGYPLTGIPAVFYSVKPILG